MQAAVVVSLAMHVSALVFLAQHDVRRFAQPGTQHAKTAPIQAHLLRPMAHKTPEPGVPSAVRAVAKRPAPVPLVETAEMPKSDGMVAVIGKLLDIKTGDELSRNDWLAAKLVGQSIRIRLTINPAGFVDRWEVVSPGTIALATNRDAINNMVRNMSTRKTGETHFVIWECQIGENADRVIANIYPLHV